MRVLLFYTVSFLQVLFAFQMNGQIDTDPPAAPELKLVTINQSTGNVEISWSLSPSPDVKGYIVYYHHYDPGFPGGGYSADSIVTLWDPTSTNYSVFRPYTSFYSESFVVAAIDSSGNTSTYSKNVLHTIFAKAQIDTCKKEIEIRWNSYPSKPYPVQSYSVLFSVEGGLFSELARVTADTSLIIDNFTADLHYCFIVRANLEGGTFSTSNKACLLTNMQRPPQWINADYATVSNDNVISLSFITDPSSEVSTYRLERKTGSKGIFEQIAQFTSVSGSLLYTDNKADINKINYYRLSAINNCNNPVTFSNIASNIVLSLERNNDDIKLIWNPYKDWLGSVGSYKLFANTDGVLSERSVITPSDTALNISYSSLMYEVTGREVCFMIKAVESSNPYGDPGESQSQIVCTPVTEVITVPNIFTPDNNGLNDLFWPVLSFTPTSYQLIITDLQRKTVFETRNPAEKWDGTNNGNPMPEGVYLWYLNAGTPSGKSISKTGNVTIIVNH